MYTVTMDLLNLIYVLSGVFTFGILVGFSIRL